MSHEDEDATVHEDDVSLTIVEPSSEFHCDDSVTIGDYKGDLDLDSCLPRFVLVPRPNSNF